MTIDRPEIERVVTSLTTAWNAADGHAFAQAFGDEADFINIYGTHAVGRDAIAKNHQRIFDGVYLGSHIVFTVVKARPLSSEAAIVLIAAELDVPQGPMMGKMRTLATAVLVRNDGGWSIAAFGNTREQAPPGPT